MHCFFRTLISLRKIVAPLIIILGSASHALADKDFPFEFHNSLIWISVSTPAQAEPLTFLLDTGASVSVLDRKTCSQLGINGGRIVPVQGIGGAIEGVWPVRFNATFAGERLPSKFLALDLTPLSESAGRKVNGILGADFFAERVVRIDYLSRKLQILNRNAFQPPKHSDAIPLKRKKGVFLVPLSINNGSLTWVRLDTGCNSDLHWVTRDSALVSRQSDLTIAGVGNTTSQTADVTASIGGHTSIVEAVLQQKPIFSGERGLLGNGFLSQFVVTVDAKNAYLYLENHSYSASSGLAP